jgi:hypothetical protein
VLLYVLLVEELQLVPLATARDDETLLYRSRQRDLGEDSTLLALQSLEIQTAP